MEPQVPTPPAEQPMSTPSPAPQSAVPSAENPGKSMGLAGLITAFFFPIVGLILSIIGLNKSKKAGMSNGLAVGGIVVSILNMILGAVVFVLIFAAGFSLAQKCADLGPGTHTVDGVTYECGN